MRIWPNLLLVGGTERNVGKTTLICRFIKQFSAKHQVTALKITPHMHGECPTCRLLYKTEQIIISEELNYDGSKDSALMLSAGASKVYYIQCSDRYLVDVIQILEPLINPNEPLICESAGLRNQVKPGLFIMMTPKDLQPGKNEKLKALADICIPEFPYMFDVNFIDGRWVF